MLFRSVEELYDTGRRCGRFLGGYSSGVPPLPIPNREVKPTNADGTAVTCGRVGSRLLKEPYSDVGLLFLFVHVPILRTGARFLRSFLDIRRADSFFPSAVIRQESSGASRAVRDTCSGCSAGCLYDGTADALEV